MKLIKVSPARDGKHKYIAYLQDGDKEHKVKFGAIGYSDFTKHHDVARRELYLGRHAAREDWEKSGILTAGFWSRWLLWNKSSLSASIADVKKRFDL